VGSAFPWCCGVSYEPAFSGFALLVVAEEVFELVASLESLSELPRGFVLDCLDA